MSQAYEQRLKELVETIPGALFSSLTGTDGIGISFYQAGQDMDPTLADAEFATMLASAQRTVQNLSLGAISELMVSTEKGLLLIRQLGTDFYLCIGMKQGTGNLGMARLLARRVSEDFKKLLY